MAKRSRKLSTKRPKRSKSSSRKTMKRTKRQPSKKRTLKKHSSKKRTLKKRKSRTKSVHKRKKTKKIVGGGCNVKKGKLLKQLGANNCIITASPDEIAASLNTIELRRLRTLLFHKKDVQAKETLTTKQTLYDAILEEKKVYQPNFSKMINYTTSTRHIYVLMKQYNKIEEDTTTTAYIKAICTYEINEGANHFSVIGTIKITEGKKLSDVSIKFGDDLWEEKCVKNIKEFKDIFTKRFNVYLLNKVGLNADLKKIYGSDYQAPPGKISLMTKGDLDASAISTAMLF